MSVVGRSPAEAAGAMAAAAPSDLAFVFSPVGWQREDMGRALYERGGPYRRVLHDVRLPSPGGLERESPGRSRRRCPRSSRCSCSTCCASPRLLPLALRSSSLPREKTRYPPKTGTLLDQGGMIDSTYFAQPALYAVEVALDVLWRSMGASPPPRVGEGG